MRVPRAAGSRDRLHGRLIADAHLAPPEIEIERRITVASRGAGVGATTWPPARAPQGDPPAAVGIRTASRCIDAHETVVSPARRQTLRTSIAGEARRRGRRGSSGAHPSPGRAAPPPTPASPSAEGAARLPCCGSSWSSARGPSAMQPEWSVTLGGGLVPSRPDGSASTEPRSATGAQTGPGDRAGTRSAKSTPDPTINARDPEAASATEGRTRSSFRRRRGVRVHAYGIPWVRPSPTSDVRAYDEISTPAPTIRSVPTLAIRRDTLAAVRPTSTAVLAALLEP